MLQLPGTPVDYAAYFSLRCWNGISKYRLKGSQVLESSHRARGPVLHTGLQHGEKTGLLCLLLQTLLPSGGQRGMWVYILKYVP